MREIKFRIWVEADKEFLEDFSIIGLDIFGEMTVVCGARGETWSEPLEKCGLIIMQWTGLLDKSGVEIYEGDIVIVKAKYIYEVLFFRGSFVLKRTSNQGNIQLRHISGIKEVNNREKVEVIGNIYKDFKLLNS